jgi:hypothetical protein
MKKIILTLGLLFGSIPLMASQTPQLVYQVGVSSVITNSVLVATFSVVPGATQVDNPQLPGRVSIEIQNVDTAANLWCVPVSTAPKAPLARKIAPGNSWIVSVADALLNAGFFKGTTAVKFWCISDGVAPSSATVTQIY